MGILAFFVLICVLVFVHEYGHFWAARRCGVKVIRFSIGFGKVLFKKTDRHGTEFAFSLIPLGGYVQMYNGEDEIQAKPQESLAQKSVLQRIFIVLAGPVANFLFAIIAYWAVFIAGVPTVKPVIGEVLPNTISAKAELLPELELKQIAQTPVRDWEEAMLELVANVGSPKVEVKGSRIGEDYLQTFYLDLSHWQIDATKSDPLRDLGIRPKSGTALPTIRQVSPNSAAEKAGVQAGDKILAINQQPFDWQALLTEVQKGQVLQLQLEKSNGERVEVSLTPQKAENGERYLIGISPEYQALGKAYRTVLQYDLFEAFGKAVEKVGSLIKTILKFIGNLITGDLSLNNMGGPISMAKGAAATAEIGLVYYLSFMALISVNLGVMNLFPLLPLDGGRLIFLTAEGLLGKALPEKIEQSFQQLGMALVLGLMVFALFNDLIHF